MWEACDFEWGLGKHYIQPQLLTETFRSKSPKKPETSPPFYPQPPFLMRTRGLPWNLQLERQAYRKKKITQNQPVFTIREPITFTHLTGPNKTGT